MAIELDMLADDGDARLLVAKIVGDDEDEDADVGVGVQGAQFVFMLMPQIVTGVQQNIPISKPR